MAVAMREKVAEIRLASPCMTLQAIGDQVGLSKQRVHQLLSDEGLKTKHYLQRERYTCLQCGGPFLVKPYWRQRREDLLYCCQPCRNAANLIPLICEECGVLFHRLKRKVLGSAKQGQEHIFCGKPCWGRWSAARYGFGAHPENIRKP